MMKPQKPSHRSRSSWLLVLAWLAFSVSSTALAAIGQQFDYAALHKTWQGIGELDGARYVRARLRLVGPDLAKAPKPIQLTIRTLQADIPLAVDADGVFELPVSAQLIAENPQVWSNVPPNLRKLEVTATVGVEAGGQREFTYRLLGEMRAELAEQMRQRGFLRRLFSPDVRGARIHFADTGKHSAVVTTDQGNVAFQGGSDGSISLPLDESWMARGYKVTLNAVPQRITLELER